MSQNDGMRLRGRGGEPLVATAVGVAAIVVSLFWVYLLSTSPEPLPFSAPSASTTGAPAVVQPTKAVFVGDGFTVPTPAGGTGAAGYPAMVASRVGWEATVLGTDGAGYVTPGDSGLTLPFAIDQAVAVQPGVVVVSGGRADIGRTPPDEVADAAGSMFEQLQSRLPSARLVAVGPVATDATPPEGGVELRDALRDRLAQVPGVTFIDPLEGAWFADAPPGAIAEDGRHPTDAGHRLVAQRLEAELVRLGIAQPTAG